MASHLPPRDPSRPAEKQGLFNKYNVSRADGADRPGCEYFVLDVAHDKHAKAAMTAYADAVQVTHPALAADMRKRYGLADPHITGLISRNEAWDLGRSVPSAWQFPASRTWYSGPPPHIGWWNASSQRKHTVWRWWDGPQWSFPVAPNTPSLVAARQAELKVRKHHVVSRIEWTDYWPENARVPRTPAEGTRWTARDTGSVFAITWVDKTSHGVFIHAYSEDCSGVARYRGYDNWIREFDPVVTK